MNRNDFTVGIKAICLQWGKDMPRRDVAAAWWGKLNYLDPRVFAEAIKLLTDNEKFFPENLPFTVKYYAGEVISERKSEERRRMDEEVRDSFDDNKSSTAAVARKCMAEIRAITSGVGEIPKDIVMPKGLTSEQERARADTIMKIRADREKGKRT